MEGPNQAIFQFPVSVQIHGTHVAGIHGQDAAHIPFSMLVLGWRHQKYAIPGCYAEFANAMVINAVKPMILEQVIPQHRQFRMNLPAQVQRKLSHQNLARS